MNAETSDLERIARKLLDIRFETERTLRANPGMTEPWGTEHPDGTLQVNYLGRDESDSYFFFSGYVMPQATLSITGELTSSNQEEIQQLFQDVLSHLTF